MALASWAAATHLRLAELREATSSLDLGSGGGIDVSLSAKRARTVGQGVRAGHDRRDARARTGQCPQQAEATNVEFLKGYIEDIPLPDASVDVIISICAINLSTDKPKAVARCSGCSGRADAW